MSHKQTYYMQRLTIGRGTIGPKQHLADGDYDIQLVESAAADLVVDNGLYVPVDGIVPRQCGDGRTEEMQR